MSKKVLLLRLAPPAAGSASAEIYQPAIVVVPARNCQRALGELEGSLVVPGFVQLVGGDSPCSGRVEVHDGNQWKTVCDSDFGPKAAEVVCRELQCGVPLSVPGRARFGEGVGPMWDRELQCAGNESLLMFCPRGSPRDQPCTHANAVSVTCTQYTGFRLVNGSTACEGRVEVQVLGTWGTLCASRWDLLDAHVLCRHLDCGFAESIPRGGHFGSGTGPVWRDSFHCEGTEAHLGQCPVTALGASPCSPENHAAVICSGPAGSTALRLVGGGSRCDGRVEILQRGTWGRVLDDEWDMREASVVCRQLRCREAEKAYNPAKPQRGTGPVGLRGVRCAGHEAGLSLCNTSLPESTAAAGIAEDVGVVCAGSRQVRLVKGPGRCAGRVEIYYQGSWGTVCDDGWDLSDAAIVCQQLGCGGAVEAVGSARFGEGSGQIWLDGVNCSGAEAALWDCPAGSWGQHDCAHKEDAGVVCSDFMALRLGNGSNCSGRLQVFYNGKWGSVCSNSMTLQTVSLACKELGCGDAGTLETRLPSGRVSGHAWLDRVECGERNSSFWQCPSAPWDPRSCDDLREETHITCSGNSELPGHQHRPSSCSLPGTIKRRDRAHGGFYFAPRTAAPTPRADPSRDRPTGSGRLSLPVIICIVLGALLCLLLALLAGQVRSARAGRAGSGRAWEPFPDAVYEEIAYGPAWEKRARFSGSGSYSEGSLAKLQPYPADSKEEEGPGSAPDVPVLPGGDPAHGYDDAREVSAPGEDPAPGQGAWEMPRAPEEGAGPRDAPGGANLRSQRSAGAPAAEGDAWSLSPESTGYDDAEEVSLAHPPEHRKAATAELSAQPSLSPAPGEPIPAVQLGAAGSEEGTLQLGEP
ncbi:scavenger receptor cysteine-rich domain-containing protein SCART1-like [Pelecanus crispus]|uniref:scavenger receptor cysteine-rich domain-containing protein SCART1-like n=1 Tax=Pelecanus crispus TaxID=36300 RepID=UPI003F5D28ED